jgi:DNA polymerase (family 10)
MNKDQVAQILTEIATLLELSGENPFKSRAYSNGARAIETLNEPLETVFAPGSEARVKGIGDSLHKKICELLATGKLAYYEELKNSVPAGLLQMLTIPGLGPKKVKALHDNLRVETLEQLEKACQDNQVAALAGFGEKTQANILSGIAFRRPDRRLAVARQPAPAPRHRALRRRRQPAARQGNYWRH